VRVAASCKVGAYYTLVDNGNFVSQAYVLEERKKTYIFDHFSPVFFQLIVKSRAFLPLMFLGHPFSSYFNNNDLVVNKSKSKTCSSLDET
jgi:hypothetical protein